jgi:hypothetical protein
MVGVKDTLNIYFLLSSVSFLDSNLFIWTNHGKPFVTNKKKRGTKWPVAGRNGMNLQ